MSNLSSEDMFLGLDVPQAAKTSPDNSVTSCQDIFAGLEEGSPSAEFKKPNQVRRPRNSAHRRIGTAPKRRLQTTVQSSIPSDESDSSSAHVLQSDNADGAEAEIAARVLQENLDVVAAKRPYVKRKGRFSAVKKKRKTPKKGNFQIVEMSSGDADTELTGSKTDFTAVVKVVEEDILSKNDGDEHLEVGFVNNCPDISNLVVPASDDIPGSQTSDILISDFSSEAMAVKAMAFNLKKLLDQSNSNWNVDTVERSGRMFLMCKLPNVAVERSIHWTPEDTQIFIHHQQLPEDTYIWNVEKPDPTNLTQVSEFLKQLSSVVETARVCEGVSSFHSYWKSCEEQGFANVESDIYSGEQCLRSESCSIVFTESKRCDSCERLRIALKKRQARVVNAADTKDARKINNRYLPRKLLLNKTVQLAAEKITLKSKLKYLRKTVKKLISKDAINVDSELNKGLSQVLKDNANKMTDIQKLFWSEQLKAIAKQRNPRSVRWSPMMVKIAIHLQSLSPTAYEYLKDSGILKLPSSRRLYDFTHFTDAKDGVQEHIMTKIKADLDKQETDEYSRYFNLLFDEMTIRSNLVVTRSGEIVGYTSLTEVETSIKDLENHLANLANESDEDTVPIKGELAKKALIFMLQGVTSLTHAVVGIYSTGDLSAEQLYSRVWDIVYHLESRDIKILCLVCDGASCNRKFFDMHIKWDHNCQFTYATKNLASGQNRPIFFIVDPPHLLKTLRNCLSNSHAHNNSRDMVKNGQLLSWEAIEYLYHSTAQDMHKEHKLTSAHIKLTAFSRMNVKLATQVLSNSVSKCLADYKDDPRLKGLATDSLIEFLSIVNIFFDCLNGSNDPEGKRNKVNKNLLPYTDIFDNRFQNILVDKVLKFFQDWHEEIHSKPDMSPDNRERMMISHQAYESLHITVLGFCGAVKYILQLGAPSVDAKAFNQDKLEQYFGILRQKGGGDNNLTFYRVTTKSNVLAVAQPAVMAGKKGNTQSTRGPLKINQDPLPARKTKRV